MKGSAIKTNPPHHLLGLSLQEYLASLDVFRLSGLYEQLEPLPEVLAWFSAQGAQYRHVALTRVPLAAAHVTAAWVLRHFGEWIRSFHFVPSFRAGKNPPVYDEDKGDFLRYFGKADLLIDDTMENIEAANKVGVRTLVFPRPWNHSKMTVEQTLAAIAGEVKS